MKKLFTIGLVIAVCSLMTTAQWQVVRQGSADIDPDIVFFLDVNTGWIAEGAGYVQQTTDGGATWTTLSADNGGESWNDMEFFDANVGYACAQKGFIYKTTDGGTNWTQIGDTANHVLDVVDLAIVDANTVYFACDDGIVLKTTDGGANFTANETPLTTDDLNGGIAFLDANKGVVATSANVGDTWYTTDGGANWTNVNLAALFPMGTTSKRLYDVAAGPNNTIIVTGYHCTIFLSTDGGQNYQLTGDISYGFDRAMLAKIVDANTFFVARSVGDIVKSTDGGASWDTLYTGTGQTIADIAFPDVNTGFSFAAYGQWMKTTDGGASWSPLQDWPSLSLWGLAFPEEDKIVLTSWGGGEMSVSTDNGVSWSYPVNYTTGTATNLYECEFLDANTGFIGGGSGYLAKTTDGGFTWTIIDNTMAQQSNKHINAMHIYDATNIYAGGSSGIIMKSTDGGDSWIAMTNTSTQIVYDIFQLDASKVFAAAGSGQIALSIDGGATFTLDYDYGSMSMRAVEFRSGVGIIPASDGSIFRTTAAEWDTLISVFTDPDGDDLYDVEFITDNLVYVVGKNGKIYKSEDAGLNWTAEVSGTTELLDKCRFDGWSLWAIGQGGTILKLEINIKPQDIAGDYYIPKGDHAQGFNTLAEAVAALNTHGATGPVTFLLDADTLREESLTFTADLTAETNLVVKPVPGRDVVLIVAPGASKGNGPQMIGFDKGYVTFDGSNDGSDSRNLVITNEEYADVPLGLNTADADMIVLKNLIIKNLDNSVNNFKYGVVTNDVAGIEGFTVENCQIGSTEFPVWRDGVAVWGTSTSPTQGIVLNNEIYAGARGITTYVVNDCVFSGNTIHMMPTTSATTYSYVHGIYLTGASGPTIIHGNTINCLEAASVSGTYVIGIAFAGNSEGEGEIISVVNNMVNVGAADETHPVYGIGFRSANNMGNIQAYHNTILLNDNASTAENHAVGNHTNGTGPVTLELKNNIIINNHSGNTGSSVIGLIPADSDLTSDYNLLVSNQNFVKYQGTSYADLAAWQALSQDVNSISKAVEFVSAIDLHLAGASIGDIDLAGTPLATVMTDIDGDTRSATSPYMGADESDELHVSIDQSAELLPQSFRLHQNYPNPFNPTTTIAFDLPEAAHVKLVVYNMMGQQVAMLKNEAMQPGYYHLNFDASRLASGVYIYRIEANRFSALKKMTVMK